ncbi:MAG: hypothetical protein FWG03_00980 [Clostridiales bacterium]|nr:hypothetical protein [Clostridiales bacterium]
MDYRKILKRVLAVCVCIALAFGFAACKDDGGGGGLGDISIGVPGPGDEPGDDPSDRPEDIDGPSDIDDPAGGEGDDPIEGDDPRGVFGNESTGAIGETYNYLLNGHPGYGTEVNGVEAYMEFGGAAFPYLGAPGAMFNYVFFGTQWGPPLADVARFYGDELECIGVIAKMGDFFPNLDWDLTFEEFFDDYVVVDDYYVYDWGSTDGPLVGQIYFQYLGFDVTIRATESHTSETLKEDFYVLMTEGDITRNEGYLQKTQEELNAG